MFLWLLLSLYGSIFVFAWTVMHSNHVIVHFSFILKQLYGVDRAPYAMVGSVSKKKPLSSQTSIDIMEKNR